EDGNTFEITPAFPLSPRFGIFLTAHDGTSANIGRGNSLGASTIRGYGQDGSGGAIYVGNQQGTIINCPTIINSLRAAICIREVVTGFSLVGAAIETVIPSSASVCTGVAVESATVSGQI